MYHITSLHNIVQRFQRGINCPVVPFNHITLNLRHPQQKFGLVSYYNIGTVRRRSCAKEAKIDHLHRCYSQNQPTSRTIAHLLACQRHFRPINRPTNPAQVYITYLGILWRPSSIAARDYRRLSYRSGQTRRSIVAALVL